jgi:uncharacterized membrane protein YgdD (TMEM256/DUF423 family)
MTVNPKAIAFWLFMLSFGVFVGCLLDAAVHHHADLPLTCGSGGLALATGWSLA